MALSTDATKRLMIGLTSAAAGNEVATALNQAIAGSVEAFASVQIVTAAAANPTLAGLLPGDIVLNLKTVASNTAANIVVVTANTIPYTPTLNDVLVVMRPVPAVANSALHF